MNKPIMDKQTGIDVAIDKYDIKTYINKEKGIVTLKIGAESIVFYGFLKDVCNQLRIPKILYHSLVRSNYLDFDEKAVIVTSKCSPKDKFDERIGKTIAFRKLKGRIRRAVIHALLGMSDDCNRAVFALYDLYMKDKLHKYDDITIKDFYHILEVTNNEEHDDWDNEEDYDE